MKRKIMQHDMKKNEIMCTLTILQNKIKLEQHHAHFDPTGDESKLVVKKPQIRHYKNDRGSGVVLSIDLIDR